MKDVRSEYGQTCWTRQLALLEGRRRAPVLQVDRGGGSFTRPPADIPDRVAALNVALARCQRAREAGEGRIDFGVANAIECDAVPERPQELTVASETIHSPSSFYSFFDVQRSQAVPTMQRAPEAASIANTVWERYPLNRSAPIRTYRGLFVTAGCRVQAEEVRARRDVELKPVISGFAEDGRDQ